MLVNLSLSPGYRLKITKASRMSELADRVITAIAAVGGSAAFLEVLRRWLQRRQDKRQDQLQLDVRILEEGHALRQEAYQRARSPPGPHRGARTPPQGRASRPGSPDAGQARRPDTDQPGWRAVASLSWRRLPLVGSVFRPVFRLLIP